MCSCRKVSQSCSGKCVLRYFGQFLTFSVLTGHIVCVLQLIITEILNIIGAALSITAVVQLSVELAVMKSSSYYEDCYPRYPRFARNNIDDCIYYKNLSKVTVFSVLCVGMCAHREHIVHCIT